MGLILSFSRTILSFNKDTFCELNKYFQENDYVFFFPLKNLIIILEKKNKYFSDKTIFYSF